MIILKTDKLKEITGKVAIGVDGDRVSPLSELIELELKNKQLTLKTTNKEYFLKTVIEDVTDIDSNLHVTIYADVFLALINKTTTSTIKLEITDRGLEMTGNGKYTFPLVLDNDEPLTLPEIPFDGVGALTFKINGNTLKSVHDFNSKELSKDSNVDYIQRHYYVDNYGAITYVETACINDFTLEQPVKLLFNERLVQLFKLFVNKEVTFSYLQGELNNKVKFTVDGAELVGITASTDLVNRYPSIKLRDFAEIKYPGQVRISKQPLLSAIERLFIFDKLGANKVDIKKCGKLEFNDKELIITNVKDGNFEVVPYENQEEQALKYEGYVSLLDLQKHIGISSQSNILLSYGTGDAIMLKRDNFIQIVPEMTNPMEYLR